MSVRFAGYAAIFDRPDRGGDVIRKGAFAASLEAVHSTARCTASRLAAKAPLRTMSPPPSGRSNTAA